MLETKLTNCAILLYQWLLPRVAANPKLTVDLQDFQAWSAEFREKPYNYTEILEAIQKLKELQLIQLSKTEVTLEVKNLQDLSEQMQLPTQMLSVESDRQERLGKIVTLAKIISGSLALSVATLLVGLTLLQSHPEILNTPHPWSVLGEKNIGSGK
ncbi:hypothetical protein IQ264_21100 [Phormidium sp. LEGE 05292]|uniref:hypothetical protein n=1 Tax=[Phormidium] sp. LEGE 05292 TaxID=767427 RepID=UPI0018827695|nr:hypothetical protein [Phormidium sp. LEGE 05292]MBE9227923.1 hypothetical protein [Phormidium sp. LEGE 05292]